MSFILDFRQRASGGTVTSGRLGVAGQTVSVRVAERRLAEEDPVTFLIHGYNNNRRKGRRKLLNFAQLLSQPSGALVATLWPGDHWSRGASFPLEGRDADLTAKMLARFIERCLPRETRLCFVTHSLGARVALACVEALKGRDPDQMCLLAAAIDDDSLAAPRAFSAATIRATRVAVLSSRGDRVLRRLYPVGNLLERAFSMPRIKRALGFVGPKPHRRSGRPVPTNVLPRRLAKDQRVDHGDYMPNGSAQAKHQRAADFCSQVLSGHPAPHYP